MAALPVSIRHFEDVRLIPARGLRGLGALVALLAASTAHGQRIQFPTQTNAPTQPPVVAPPTTAPLNTAPLTTPPPSLAPSVGANLQGNITPADPTWDPYADPLAEPQVLYPDGGYMQPDGYIQPDGTLAEPVNLFHDIRFEHTWLVGDGSVDDRLDWHTLELNATFAFPFLWNPAPILVTPGFAANYLAGPNTPPAMGDLPPRLYDAYLDTSWQPVFTSWLSGDLGARVGVYSDFDEVNADSIRVISRGLGIIHFSQRFSIALGIVYLDRNKVKLLPAGGFVWVPDEDTRYELIFPYPRISHRFTTIGTHDVWGYIGGEYGGGAWTIKHANGQPDRIDYNDLRAFGGIELVGLKGYKAWFEVGFVWDREIFYVGGIPPFKPDDTVMLRGGMSY